MERRFHAFSVIIAKNFIEKTGTNKKYRNRIGYKARSLHRSL